LPCLMSHVIYDRMSIVTSPDPSPSAQELVFTLYGDFLRQRGEAVWVGSLISLLEPVGLSATNVRTVLSRMAAKGWLAAERVGRRSYYGLTSRGADLLEEGAARIYTPPRQDDWDGEWTLVAYSIPEERRASRDRLRVRLEWLGFGSLGNGLWVTPHDVGERVFAVSAELEVSAHVEVFRGAHVGGSSPRRLVTQLWDLDDLNGRYEAFVARHLDACVLLREGGPASVAPREAYERRFGLVHEYRQFPQVDPFLPRPLQPSDWAGECALALFRHYHDLLEPPADRFVETLVETCAVEPSTQLEQSNIPEA
jgi:phenylacetic acid degradation operon negative regulatory protein